MTTRAIIIIAAIIGMAVPLGWIRLAPTEAARWHVDPVEVARVPDKPRRGGWLVRPGDANAAAPVFDADPGALLAALDKIARSTPRTRRIAGDPGSGMITYVTRSAVFGFPDFTSIRVLPQPGGATLAIWARNRFGGADLGVNRRRVEGWLAVLSERLSRRAGLT